MDNWPVDIEALRQRSEEEYRHRLIYCPDGGQHDYQEASSHSQPPHLIEEVTFACSVCGYKKAERRPSRDARLLIDALAEAIAVRLEVRD